MQSAERRRNLRSAQCRAALEQRQTVAVGLVLPGGYVLAAPEDLDWRSALIAGASAVGLVATRVNPLWLLAAGGAAGAVLFG